MEPTEASNLDDQYKYYWEGDLCDHEGQEDGLPLCIRSCLAGGGAVGCRARQNLLSSQGWVQPPGSGDTHLDSQPVIHCTRITADVK